MDEKMRADTMVKIFPAESNYEILVLGGSASLSLYRGNLSYRSYLSVSPMTVMELSHGPW